MKGQIFKANGIDIWAESFGNPDHPAFLLIMGGCCQGILWPTEFCAALADQGFYVIRYDHRDAGLSTCFNFDEAPYTHFDMAKDAIGLLDALGIEKAHLFGLSTGGSIGQIIAAHFPSRVLSLGLIATSTDFEPLDRALQGKPPLSEGLSSPSEAYLSAMDQFLHDVPETEEEELEQRVAIWQLLNGSKIPLEENAQRKLHMEFLKRLRWRPGLENHIRANYLSEDVLREAANKIRVPTIVFQGSEDPIFQPDHGEALAGAISGSSYHVLEGHGHVPNPHFFDVIVEKLAWNARRPMPSGSDFYVHSGSIKLWVETFGPPSLPSVLLISGAGASARFWTDDMCERIASGGYYVACGASSIVAEPQTLTGSIGVFGVRQAPVLLNNLAAAVSGEEPAEYRPQRTWLSILDLGDDTGLLLYGRIWFIGRAALWLKRRLDRRFVHEFAVLSRPA